MPASCRAVPAGCIFGLSFFEPMMIPTRGASTSISSKASSTAGIGVDSVGWGSSEISLISSFLWLGLTGDALDGAGGDVGAHLLPVELDPPGRIVCAIAGRGRGGPERRHVEDPTSGGKDLAVVLRRAGVGDLGELGGVVEAADRVAHRGALRVAGRGEDQGH